MNAVPNRSRQRPGLFTEITRLLAQAVPYQVLRRKIIRFWAKPAVDRNEIDITADCPCVLRDLVVNVVSTSNEMHHQAKISRLKAELRTSEL